MTLRVKEPFAVDQAGFHRVLRPGDLIAEGDPVVKGREQFFEPVEAQVIREQARVEAASAAPGELRTRTTPRKRAVKKTAKKAAVKKTAAAPAGKSTSEQV